MRPQTGISSENNFTLNMARSICRSLTKADETSDKAETKPSSGYFSVSMNAPI